MVNVRIGVLALQGGFDSHVRRVRDLGALVREVRRCAELPGLDGLIIPGGESTTLLNLMQDEPWFDALRRFHASNGSIFGTCAGLILLAREVRQPAQPSLALLDVVVERNSYGRQVDSFEATIDTPVLGGPIPGVFIRAPRLVGVGPAVEVLGRLDGEPVLVRQDQVLAATFHPELTSDSRVHRSFLELATAGRAVVRAAG